MRLIPKMIEPPWCFGYRPGFTFSIFSGLAEMHLVDKTWPRKSTLALKNWHFLGLFFKLNCLNLSNTSSMQSNMSLIVRAKMQMSLKYSNRVTNCWSPKHCSIKQQKLEPTFESLNGIQVNSYKPIELALNAVFLCCFPTLLVGGTPVPGQMKKTSYYCGQPVGLCQFLVVEMHILPWLNWVSGDPCTDEFPLSFLHNHYLGCIMALQ